jgi:hypothetical protein
MSTASTAPIISGDTSPQEEGLPPCLPDDALRLTHDLALQKRGKKAPCLSGGMNGSLPFPSSRRCARRHPGRVAGAETEPLWTLLPTVGLGGPLGRQRSGLPHA